MKLKLKKEEKRQTEREKKRERDREGARGIEREGKREIKKSFQTEKRICRDIKYTTVFWCAILTVQFRT